MDRATWVDRFANHLSRLHVRAEPEHLVGMAEELYDTQQDLVPEEAAQAEYDAWPPHDD